jgi:hypothetical protein
MSKLNAAAVAQWYDPSANVYTTIPGSPLSNSGTVDFIAPGSNSDGNEDWVLILQAIAPPILTLTRNQADVDLQVMGVPDEQYTIQSSDDLKSWSAIAVVADPTGVSHYTDSGALSKQRAYYRLSYSDPTVSQAVLAPEETAGTVKLSPAPAGNSKNNKNSRPPKLNRRRPKENAIEALRF